MPIVERRLPMKTLILILCAIAICFGAYGATGTHAGVWTAELQDDHLQITIFQSNRDAAGDRRNFDDRMGFDVPLADLSGLARADVSSDAANVKFLISREA